MTIVPAGSLVRKSTYWRRRLGGSCVAGPSSGRTSGGNDAYWEFGAAPGTAPVGGSEAGSPGAPGGGAAPSTSGAWIEPVTSPGAGGPPTAPGGRGTSGNPYGA